MSRKLLVILSVFVFGAFTAPMAMALSIPDVATSEADGTAGATAGTIVNPEGKGDALIFPYYDVRQLNGKNQDFYFAIINDSGVNADGTDVPNHGIVGKLRFREWDKSLEVYDINIWLSCNDVWVGLITQDTTQQLAQLWSPDWVATSDPSQTGSISLQAALDVRDAAGNLIGRPFRPQLIPIDNNRTLYGYFEFIAGEATACKATNVTGSGSSKTGSVARLCVGGVCPDAPNQLQAYAYVVRVADGISAAYNATAIANFARNAPFNQLFFSVGSTHPHLGDCEDTIDQVEFMLAKRYVSQGYSIESSIGAIASAVLTFPTKHFHFDGPPNFLIHANNLNYTVGLASPDRGEPFNGAHMNAGEEIRVVIWDRSESPFTVPPGFESPTTGAESIKLQYELNIIGFLNTTGACPSSTSASVRDNKCLPTGGRDSGWFKIDLNGTTTGFDTGTHIKTLPDGNLKIAAFNWFGDFFATYHGLPAIGMLYQEFSNGNVGGVYGQFLPVYYEVDWR